MQVPGVDTPEAEARAIASLYAAALPGEGGAGGALRERLLLVVERGGGAALRPFGQCLRARGADDAACVRAAWAAGALERPDSWLESVERRSEPVRCGRPPAGDRVLDDSDFDVTPTRPGPAPG